MERIARNPWLAGCHVDNGHDEQSDERDRQQYVFPHALAARRDRGFARTSLVRITDHIPAHDSGTPRQLGDQRRHETGLSTTSRNEPSAAYRSSGPFGCMMV